jgi:hypothetical protein
MAVNRALVLYGTYCTEGSSREHEMRNGIQMNVSVRRSQETHDLLLVLQYLLGSPGLLCKTYSL